MTRKSARAQRLRPLSVAAARRDLGLRRESAEMLVHLALTKPPSAVLDFAKREKLGLEVAVARVTPTGARCGPKALGLFVVRDGLDRTALIYDVPRDVFYVASPALWVRRRKREYELLV